MSADRKILLLAGVIGIVVAVATAITSDIDWLRPLAAVSMLYSLGVVLVAATGIKEDA